MNSDKRTSIKEKSYTLSREGKHSCKYARCLGCKDQYPVKSLNVKIGITVSRPIFNEKERWDMRIHSSSSNKMDVCD